jgi:hypothetical protein
MTNATVSIQTAQATRYSAQLLSHWKHHSPVLNETETGIVMAFGQTSYTIEPNADALTITIEAADVPSLRKARLAIEEHINRFGFRESSTFAWNWRQTEV